MRLFDSGFVWGTGTSSFQIEGAPDAGGREPSIWDDFCAVPGAIANGDDGRPGVGHVERWAEDVALLAGLGCPAYRFSVSWSRVLRADGSVNAVGMDFYSRLVDGLLAAGIEPWLTLYHWDLPSSLPGGWLHRDTAARFADYALAVHGRLGDRVRQWTTLNEPWCSAMLGYGSGDHAPGRRSVREAFVATHHLLLAHGLAVTALREAGAGGVGITLNHTPGVPADPADAADVDAVRRVDGTGLRVFADPLFRGAYPRDVVEDAGADWPADVIADGDLATISAPVDFLGINFYATQQLRAGLSGAPAASSPHVTAPAAVAVPRGLPMTAMGWEIDPDGLRALLVRLRREYAPEGVDLYVTENGAAFDDRPGPDGAVHDADRIGYVREHLRAVARANAEGAGVRGYFLWSLLDNFEWAYGYDRRFGIVRVADDLARVPKDSARWYSRVIASGDPDA